MNQYLKGPVVIGIPMGSKERILLGEKRYERVGEPGVMRSGESVYGCIGEFSGTDKISTNYMECLGIAIFATHANGNRFSLLAHAHPRFISPRYQFLEDYGKSLERIAKNVRVIVDNAYLFGGTINPTRSQVGAEYWEMDFLGPARALQEKTQEIISTSLTLVTLPRIWGHGDGLNARVMTEEGELWIETELCRIISPLPFSELERMIISQKPVEVF